MTDIYTDICHVFCSSVSHKDILYILRDLKIYTETETPVL